jgi:hypothetical protein
MKKFLLCCMLMLSTPVCANDTIEGAKRVIGGWTIIEYLNPDKTFSHCSASIEYFPKTKQGREAMRSDVVSMMIKYYVSGTMSIILLGNKWKFTDGNSYSIQFNMSDNQVYNVDAIGDKRGALISEFSPNTDWYKSLMGSESMEILIEGSSVGGFPLKKSRDSLGELLKCWNANVNPEDTSFGEGRSVQ